MHSTLALQGKVDPYHDFPLKFTFLSMENHFLKCFDEFKGWKNNDALQNNQILSYFNGIRL
jgi:hypothetical protein